MDKLEINDEIELNVLHMLIIEAKFSKHIDRMELRTSPYVCQLSKKVLMALNENDQEIAININAYPDLVKKIPSFIRELSPDIWNKWNRDDRKIYLDNLICPFVSDSDVISEYLDIELPYYINDYPEIFEQKVKDLKYEVEINDPEFWRDMEIYQRKKEIEYSISPYKVDKMTIDDIYNIVFTSNSE